MYDTFPDPQYIDTCCLTRPFFRSYSKLGWSPKLNLWELLRQDSCQARSSSCHLTDSIKVLKPHNRNSCGMLNINYRYVNKLHTTNIIHSEQASANLIYFLIRTAVQSRKPTRVLRPETTSITHMPESC